MNSSRVWGKHLWGLGLSAAVIAYGIVAWRPNGYYRGQAFSEALMKHDSVAFLVEALVATMMIFVGAVVIGSAAVIALPRAHRARLGLVLRSAVGLAVLACAGLAEWGVTGRISASPWIALGGSVVAITVATIVTGAKSGWRAVGRSALVTLMGWWRGLDLVILMAVTVVVVPVARFGLTAWTTNVYDWHRYASSAVIALDGHEAFLSRFAGHFGVDSVARSTFEKKGMTALVASVSELSGIHPLALLTPLTAVILAILVASTSTLVRRVWRIRPAHALGIGIATSLGLPVVTRTFEAQLGGVAATAFIAGAIAIAATFRGRVGPPRAALAGAFAATVAVLGIGSNSTVALVVLPVAVIPVLWAWHRLSLARRDGLWFVAGAAGIMIVAGSALAHAFVTSFGTQSSTGPSFPVLELPTAAAAFGLEPPGGFPNVAAALLTWIAVVAASLSLAWFVGRRSIDTWWVTALIASAVAFGCVFVVTWGANSYLTGKWLATVLPLVTPMAVGFGIAALSRTHHAAKAVTIMVTAVATTAIAFASCVGYGAWQAFTISPDELASTPELRDVDTVNITTTDFHTAGLLPLVVPRARVVVVAPTYAWASPPEGDQYLIDATMLGSRHWDDVRQISPHLYLATLNLDTDGSIDFTTDPTAGDHLFGAWNSRGPGSSVLAQHANPDHRALLVADVPKRPDGAHTLRVVIDGVAAGTTANAPPITLVGAMGDTRLIQVVEYAQPFHLVFDIPADSVPHSGRVATALTTGGDPSQSGARMDSATYEWLGG